MVIQKKIENNSTIQEARKYVSKGYIRPELQLYKTTAICLRIPFDLLHQMDNRVKKRAALSRTAWILEAIQEKLDAQTKEPQYE